MNFFNKSILRFSIIAIVLAVVFFLVLDYLIKEEMGMWMLIASIQYGVAMFINGFVNGKRDIYEGHYGFNYNLVTYVLGCSIPLLMALSGLISDRFLDVVADMYLYWGIAVLIHGVVYLILRRNRAIKGFDKGEIFE